MRRESRKCKEMTPFWERLRLLQRLENLRTVPGFLWSGRETNFGLTKSTWNISWSTFILSGCRFTTFFYVRDLCKLQTFTFKEKYIHIIFKEQTFSSYTIYIFFNNYILSWSLSVEVLRPNQLLYAYLNNYFISILYHYVCTFNVRVF